MARRYRQKRYSNLTLLIILAVFVTFIFSASVGAHIETALRYTIGILLCIAIIVGAAILIYYIYRHANQQRRARNTVLLQRHDIDIMTGREFELFLAQLLIARGFNVDKVFHGNDRGVDILASKNSERYSIQAKRYRGRSVGRDAITDAVAGKQYHDCMQAMAITNSYFTKTAKEYAKKTKCILVDRDELASWVSALDVA